MPTKEMVNMPNDHCRALIEYIPFIGAIIGHQETSPLLTSLIEKAIIATAAAGMAVYVGYKVLENDVNNIKGQLAATTLKIDRLDDRVFNLQVQVSSISASGVIRKYEPKQ
jgi:hypothetical protein